MNLESARQILEKQKLTPQDINLLNSLSSEELDNISPPYKTEDGVIKDFDINKYIESKLDPDDSLEKLKQRVQEQKNKMQEEEQKRIAEIRDKYTSEFYLKTQVNSEMFFYIQKKLKTIQTPAENIALLGRAGTGKTTEMYAALLKLSETHDLDADGQRITFKNKPRILYLPWRGAMQDRIFWQPSEFRRELSEYFYTKFAWIFIDDFMVQDFVDPIAKSYFTRFIGLQWEMGAKFYYTANVLTSDKFLELFTGNGTLFDRMKPKKMDFTRFMGNSYR